MLPSTYVLRSMLTCAVTLTPHIKLFRPECTPEMKEIVTKWMAGCDALGRTLLAALAVGLGLGGPDALLSR